MHYVAFVHTDDTPGFGFSLPNFPDCVVQGDTIDDALRLALKALAFHIESIAEDGEAIPSPRDIQEIETDPGLTKGRQDATLAYVPLISGMRYPKRANISIDPGLLKAIDDAAKSRGMNRSAFLADAFRKKIAGSW